MLIIGPGFTSRIPLSSRTVPKEGWPRRLFLQGDALFLRILEFRSHSYAQNEVKGLRRILKVFRVPKKSRILDVACGIGRHSILLAREGYQVVGIDFSPLFIRRATANARRRRVARKTRFSVGDVRTLEKDLAGEAEFDVILNLWSSHGYYTPKQDVQMFRALREKASSKCILIVDDVNKDFLTNHFEKSTVANFGNLELRERRTFDHKKSIVSSSWSFFSRTKQGPRLLGRFKISPRIYTLRELRKLLQKAGWHYLKSYGGFGLEPFNPESRRMIVCCRA